TRWESRVRLQLRWYRGCETPVLLMLFGRAGVFSLPLSTQRQGCAGAGEDLGLPTDRLVAADRLSDEGEFEPARAGALGALAARGPLPEAAGTSQGGRARAFRAPRRSALCQRTHSHRHRAEQGAERYGDPREVDGGVPLSLRSRVGHARPSHRDAAGAGRGARPARGRDRRVPARVPGLRTALRGDSA